MQFQQLHSEPISGSRHGNRPTIGFFNVGVEADWALWPWQGITDAARERSVNVITYVTNIRDGLSQADPAGATAFAANADAYVAQLKELDQWIAEQVKQIPEKKRILVTNHESFGYFADRYGFEIAGSILPSVSTGASPSARELAELTRKMKAVGAGAIFLETGNNPQLATQLAKETGIRTVTALHTHSITEPGGPAPTYIDMMRFNTKAIVTALK